MSKEYFWDEHGIVEKFNSTLLPVAGIKDGIVLTPNAPKGEWENWRIQWGKMLYDKYGDFEVGEFTKAGRLHYWYMAGGKLSGAKNWNMPYAYAYSDDNGATWTKPNLGLFDFIDVNNIKAIEDGYVITGDGGDNNIVFVGRKEMGFTEDSSVGLTANEEWLRNFIMIYDTLESDENKRWKMTYLAGGDWEHRKGFCAYSSDGIRWARYNTPLTTDDIMKRYAEYNSGGIVTHDGKYALPMQTSLQKVYGTLGWDYLNDWHHQYVCVIDDFLPPSSAYAQMPQEFLTTWDANSETFFGNDDTIRSPIDLSDGEEGEWHEVAPHPIKDIWGDLYINLVGTMYADGADTSNSNVPEGSDIALFTIRGSQYNPKAITRVGTKASHKIIKQGNPATQDFDCGLLLSIQGINKNGEFPFIETNDEIIWFYTGFPVGNGLQAAWDGATDIAQIGKIHWRKDGMTKIDISQNGYIKTLPIPKSGLLNVNHNGYLKIQEYTSDDTLVQEEVINGDYISTKVFNVSEGNYLKFYNSTGVTTELYSYSVGGIQEYIAVINFDGEIIETKALMNENGELIQQDIFSK